MNECCIEAALNCFLAGFPDDADSWAKATDELPDMYNWISAGGTRLPSVGRKNCRTPSEWNQKYKAAIREGFAKLDKKTKDDFLKRYSYWLTGVEE